MISPAASDSSFSGSRVLITGGLGFIGSNLGRRLVHAGADVCLVDSLVPEYGGNFFNVQDYAQRVQINISDVRDRHSFRHLVEGRDFLFNLAGQTSHWDSMEDPFTDLEINCRAQLSILETCRHFNPRVRVVFASTRQLYGKPDYLPVDEKHLLRPVDINGINKMAGEQYHILFNKVYGLHTCALRLTNTYGPGMRIKDARQTFLGVWIRQIFEGTPIEVWEGEQQRDFNFVDDAVEALLLAAQRPEAAGEIFNLGATEVVDLRTLAEQLIAAHGSGSFRQCSFPEERKRIDIGNYYADFGLIQRTLGWSPRVGLKEGLQKTVEFYRRNYPHYV
jgi:UDP-glucose 4-epimerase